MRQRKAGQRHIQPILGPCSSPEANGLRVMTARGDNRPINGEDFYVCWVAGLYNTEFGIF